MNAHGQIAMFIQRWYRHLILFISFMVSPQSSNGNVGGYMISSSSSPSAVRTILHQQHSFLFGQSDSGKIVGQWRQQLATALGLESALRPRGRPANQI
jgi:hypothetical protein